MSHIKIGEVRLGTGHAVEISEGGDPDGVTVAWLHGTPGSKILFGPHVEDAEGRGVMLLGLNRSGYGGSTRQKGSRIANGASDVQGSPTPSGSRSSLS